MNEDEKQPTIAPNENNAPSGPIPEVIQKTTVSPQNAPISTPIVPKQDKLDLWCAYAQKREGWFPGSDSYENNNPGNLKYLGQTLAINTGPKNGSVFCKFKTYADGYKTLYDMFLADCTGKSSVHPMTETILEYYQGIIEHGIYVNGYAPASDNNDPVSYANDAAEAMGVPVTTQIKDLI